MRRTLAEQAEHARRERDALLAHDIERIAARLAEQAVVMLYEQATIERIHFEALVKAYHEDQW